MRHTPHVTNVANAIEKQKLYIHVGNWLEHMSQFIEVNSEGSVIGDWG